MKSIRYTSMMFLSGISLLVMFVIFAGSYIMVDNYFKNSFEQLTKESNNTLSIVLREPIFAYDKALTEDILSSFVQFPSIHEIKAFDHRGKTIAQVTEQGATISASELQVSTVDIIWGGNRTVGSIEISYRLDSNDEVLSLTQIMFAVIAVMLLIALSATNWLVLGRAVVRPIKLVADAMEEIARGEGDLTKRLNVKSEDEVGMLAKSFDIFLANLHSLVQRIVNSADELVQYSTQISSDANTNASATQNQLREIEQVATALNEMASTTQEVSNNANTTAEKTQTCNQLADKGNTIVTRTVDEIHSLGRDLEHTSEKISELKDRSEQINTVLDVIKEIAEQTNLLALNAAIEAARAGEYGRGFAVVADEVRGLAQRTQDSTEEIEVIIKDLQSSSVEAKDLMSVTSTSLGQTMEESSLAIQALEDIIHDINQINDMNTQIATATEEQNVVTAEISEKVETINTITSTVTSNASRVGELSNTLENVSTSIKNDLSKFKL